jgi:hypothetical protein
LWLAEEAGWETILDKSAGPVAVIPLRTDTPLHLTFRMEVRAEKVEALALWGGQEADPPKQDQGASEGMAGTSFFLKGIPTQEAVAAAVATGAAAVVPDHELDSITVREAAEAVAVT